MSCNCKSNLSENSALPKKDLTNSLLFRLFLFLISLVILPLIFPVAVIILFNSMVLQKNTDIMKPIMGLFNKKEKLEDETEEDSEDFDYQIMDLEEDEERGE
jgi:hypothetical protein